METTIYNAGRVYSRDKLYGAGSGAQITRDLFNDVIQEIARRSNVFYYEIEEHPFSYKERQFHSIVFPAIANVSQVAFLEQPMTPKKIRENKNKVNWIDYWALYRDIVFLIEVKHHWISVNTRKVRKNALKGWNNDINKLKNLDPQDFVYTKPTVIRCCLSILPAYEVIGKRSNSKINSYDDAKILLSEAADQFEPRPIWQGLWYLHKKLQEPVEITEKTSERYPCVLFFLYVL